ncbi:MAG: LA_2272 family surface repeat-containing protein [Nitrospiria bacterium]
MKKILIGSVILLAVFVSDASASPGVSLKGNGLSFGNVRSGGSIVDGLSLTLGSSESKQFEEINGVSLSLWKAARRIKGLSISPFYAGTDDAMKGMALSPLLSYPNRLKGVAIGGLHTRGNIAGLTIAPFVGNNLLHIPATIINYALFPLGFFLGEALVREPFFLFIHLPADSGDTMTGITISGALMGGNIKGIAIAGLSSNTNRINGLLIAPLYNSSHELHGMQLGGLMNFADTVHGFQLAFGNGSNELHGVQIGFFNFSKELHGTQIGILNLAENNPWYRRILPFINWHEK